LISDLIYEQWRSFRNFDYLFLSAGGLDEVEGVGEEIVGLITVQELEGFTDSGDLVSAGLLPLVELLVGLLAFLLQVSQEFLVGGEGTLQ
jgi:hypothetical protein